jgi:PAS domain S-box-containing protein
MDEYLYQKKYTEYVVLSALAALILIIFTIFLGLVSSVQADFTFSGIVWLFKHNPVYWAIMVMAVLFPFVISLIIHRVKLHLKENEKIKDFEQKRIDHVSEFINQLTQSNFDVEYTLAGENDKFGEELINLRDTLKQNHESNLKIRREEEQRNWIAEGSAHFSEILRNHLNDPKQLSFIIIRDLTKYVNAIQGGFYMLEDSDPGNRYFELMALFAYDRKKFTDHRIKWGDGLIGTCALEQKTIHLKSIPDSYLTVTSGLGEANPNNLLLIPMQYENQVYGVLEFASFGKFEANHIMLIEKIAGSVASTISTLKSNLRTARLLEESKAQTQALTSQEEEMRQNMEELQATQEEATRQSQRLNRLEEFLDENVLRAEFDPEGKLTTANSLFGRKFEFGRDIRIDKKQIGELLGESEQEWFNNIWNDLIKKGQSFQGEVKFLTRSNKDLWAHTSMSISKNDEGIVDKVMFLAIDITGERSAIMKNESIIETTNATNVRLELDINGNIVNCNDYFISVFKYTHKDIKSLTVFDIINSIELEAFNKRWENIIRGESYSGVLRGKTTSGDEIWINGAFNFTYNAAHEIDRIVYTGIDITKERALEAKLSNALETIKKQERMIKDSEKELINKLRETKAELQSQFKEIERIKNLNEKMLEEIHDAIVTTSHDNHIVFFNKAAESLWKMERGDVIGKDIGILFPESLTEKDELIGSFVRPGDHKITGKRQKSIITDSTGKEKRVQVLITKAKVDNENAYMAFFQQEG